jgi:hypothetical protein
MLECDVESPNSYCLIIACTHEKIIRSDRYISDNNKKTCVYVYSQNMYEIHSSIYRHEEAGPVA